VCAAYQFQVRIPGVTASRAPKDTGQKTNDYTEPRGAGAPERLRSWLGRTPSAASDMR
jgi:hypothetical protein